MDRDTQLKLWLEQLQKLEQLLMKDLEPEQLQKHLQWQKQKQVLEQWLLEVMRRQSHQKSLKLKKQRHYAITSKLVYILPEECIAELQTLHQRMKSQQRPLWFIRLRMLQEIVELLWAFHVHIKLENLWLPGKNNKMDE